MAKNHLANLPISEYRFVSNRNEPVHPFGKILLERSKEKSFRLRLSYCLSSIVSQGTRKHRPPRAMGFVYLSLLQGMCFYYDPQAKYVRCSVTQLAVQCGLATTTPSGKISVSRAWRALNSLDKELGLITFDGKIGFRPALFEILGITPDKPPAGGSLIDIACGGDA